VDRLVLFAGEPLQSKDALDFPLLNARGFKSVQKEIGRSERAPSPEPVGSPEPFGLRRGGESLFADIGGGGSTATATVVLESGLLPQNQPGSTQEKGGVLV